MNYSFPPITMVLKALLQYKRSKFLTKDIEAYCSKKSPLRSHNQIQQRICVWKDYPDASHGELNSRKVQMIAVQYLKYVNLYCERLVSYCSYFWKEERIFLYKKLGAPVFVRTLEPYRSEMF